MPRLSSIQGKALLLLFTFSASFTIFCHCTAMAAPTAHASCCHCHKTSSKDSGKSCQGMQAVKFNLLEKQTADHICPAPAPLTAIIQWTEQPQQKPQPKNLSLPQLWSYKHSPPNPQVLHQCFLI